MSRKLRFAGRIAALVLLAVPWCMPTRGAGPAFGIVTTGGTVRVNQHTVRGTTMIVSGSRLCAVDAPMHVRIDGTGTVRAEAGTEIVVEFGEGGASFSLVKGAVKLSANAAKSMTTAAQGPVEVGVTVGTVLVKRSDGRETTVSTGGSAAVDSPASVVMTQEPRTEYTVKSVPGGGRPAKSSKIAKSARGAKLLTVLVGGGAVGGAAAAVSGSRRTDSPTRP